MEVPWSTVVLALAMLTAVGVGSAEPSDRSQNEPTSGLQIRTVGEVESQLAAVREALDEASAEVVRRAAAKHDADRAADQAIAMATQGLRPGRGRTTVGEEKAARLRAAVANAISASNEAGQALDEAKSALAAVESAAAAEFARAIETVKAARRAAESEVSALEAEAQRAADDVARAVAEVEEAESARLAAEAEAEGVRQLAVAAIDEAAAARRSLADARAAEIAFEERLAKLVAEKERLTERDPASN